MIVQQPPARGPLHPYAHDVLLAVGHLDAGNFAVGVLADFSPAFITHHR